MWCGVADDARPRQERPRGTRVFTTIVPALISPLGNHPQPVIKWPLQLSKAALLQLLAPGWGFLGF